VSSSDKLRCLFSQSLSTSTARFRSIDRYECDLKLVSTGARVVKPVFLEVHVVDLDFVVDVLDFLFLKRSDLGHCKYNDYKN
jgi:hypothetical protein